MRSGPEKGRVDTANVYDPWFGGAEGSDEDIAEKEDLMVTSSKFGVSASFWREMLSTRIRPGMKTWEFKKEVVMPWSGPQKCALVKILDQKYVGRATVFVSHAYGYDINETAEVVLRYEEKHPNSFFWFDPVCL